METASTYAGNDSIVDAPTNPSTNHVETGSTVLAVDASIAYFRAVSVVLAVDFLTIQAVADSIVLIVVALLTCAGADTLVIVVDALMAQVWVLLTALDMDIPQADVGTDSMCLVSAVDAPMTQVGTVSMALIVNAPKTSAGAHRA